jgi:hypothetical protein
MKATLIKISSFIMCILIAIVIICDSYMLFITIKMSHATLFENLKIASDYKLFSRMPMGSISLSVTLLLLIILIVTFLNKIRIINRNQKKQAT